MKGKLRLYADWRSAPLTQRRGDTLWHGCERGITALTTCKQELYSAIFRRINTAANKDRRNVMLHAVGSADNATAYVFGMHLNYDALLDSGVIEQDAITAGDYQAKAPFRRYARCWLKGDYDEAVRKSNKRKQRLKHGLQDDIEAAYVEASQREDIEVSPPKEVVFINGRLSI